MSERQHTFMRLCETFVELNIPAWVDAGSWISIWLCSRQNISRPNSLDSTHLHSRLPVYESNSELSIAWEVVSLRRCDAPFFVHKLQIQSPATSPPPSLTGLNKPTSLKPILVTSHLVAIVFPHALVHPARPPIYPLVPPPIGPRP
eukprot:248156-Pyramimonas_sp.AAC.3